MKRNYTLVHGKAADSRTSWLSGFMLAALKKIRHGSLTFSLPDGRIYEIEGKSGDMPHADISIHDDRAWLYLLTHGFRGFIYAYMQQYWCSTNLGDLFELVLKNEKHLKPLISRNGYMPYRLNTNYTASIPDRHNNTFFAQWLDRSMCYSCGIFKNDDDTLETAQINKYKSLCERLALEPHHKILEVGPGYGGFAVYAAQNYGVRMTLLTDSRRQKAYLDHLMQEENVHTLVDVTLRHPKDLDHKYDRIVACEHLERIGDNTWPSLFEGFYDCLVPGGRAELQCVVIHPDLYRKYRNSPDFIRWDINPLCKLPDTKTLNTFIADAKLLDLGHVSLGENYYRTILCWFRNFHDKWPQIQLLGYDARYRRLFDVCMMYCAAGFKSGTINVIQKSLAKPYDTSQTLKS